MENRGQGLAEPGKSKPIIANGKKILNGADCGQLPKSDLRLHSFFRSCFVSRIICLLQELVYTIAIYYYFH